MLDLVSLACCTSAVGKKASGNLAVLPYAVDREFSEGTPHADAGKLPGSGDPEGRARSCPGTRRSAPLEPAPRTPEPQPLPHGQL